jgi:hypothetical protein
MIARTDADGAWTLESSIAYMTQRRFIVKMHNADATDTSATLIFGSDFASVAPDIRLGSRGLCLQRDASPPHVCWRY